MQLAGTTHGGEESRDSVTAALSAGHVPSRIGKYEVKAEIGNGTLVKAFRASDLDTARPVLLKVLTDVRDRRLVEVFRREVANAARLCHRNLITIYELGEHEGLPFAAMQDLDGGDLRQAIQADSPLTLLQKVTIMWQVGEGLRAAHHGGFNYVGVRPSGIFLAEDGSAIIQDFSIVRLIGAEQEEDLSYASPEELNDGSSPDAVCDVFSFGAIYYELLTGAHPFQTGNPAPPRNGMPECPEALQRLVERALDRNRARRYQNMDDVQDDAEPILFELKRVRAGTLLADARRMQAAGDLEQAQAVMREVLELDPANRKARQLHSALRAEQQRRALQERLRALFEEADQEAAARRFARAVEILHSAAQLDGSSSEAAERLERMCARLERSQNIAQFLADARQLLVEENLPEAHAKASQAHALDPDWPETGDLLRAIAAAIEDREREARIERELADVSALLEKNDYAGAIGILNELNSAFPGSPVVDQWLARVEEQRAAHERQTRLQRELEEIRTLLGGERLPEAVAGLTALAADFPSDQAVLDLLERAQADLKRAETIANCKAGCDIFCPLGEFEKAMGIVDAALEAYPAHPDLLALRRRVEREGQAFRAAAAASRALAEAQWLLDEDRPHLAAKLLRENAALLPDQPELQARLDSIERILPEWENRRFVQDCLGRAAALEQSEQWNVALTLVEQALETCPASQELLQTADRLRDRRRQEEQRKKLARRLEAIQQRIAAGAWTEAISLIETSLAEYPAEPDLEQRLEEANAGRRRAECEAMAAEVRQYLTDGDVERAEEILLRGMESLPGEPALEGLWEELEAGKRCLEQCGAARVLYGRRQYREAEEILAPLAAQNRPDAQALLEAVRAARVSSEDEDFLERSRDQGLKLIEQHEFEQAAALIRNLLTLYPGHPILTRDLEKAEAGLAGAAAGNLQIDGGTAALSASGGEPVRPPSIEVAPGPPARLSMLPQETTVRRTRFQPYVLWAAIGASVLVLLITAGATIGRLSRSQAHAAAQPAKPLVLDPGVSVEILGAAPQAEPVPPPVAVKPKERVATAVSRQPFSPPSFPPPAADRTAAPPALPAPTAVAVPAPQVAPRLPVDLIQVPPPPAPVQKPLEQPAATRLPETRNPEPAPPKIQEPKVTSHPPPATPALAQLRGIHGVVKLEATVGERGTVTDVKVISGDPILALAAKAAVRQWRYEPGLLNGRPLAMKVQIQVVFEGRK